MTKFDFSVEIIAGNAISTITRLADGATKTFLQAGHNSPIYMEYFLNSLTDVQVESYFGKAAK